MPAHILFYGVDSVGLGHLSRAVAIGRAVLETDPEAAPAVLAESVDARIAALSGIPAIQITPRRAYKLQPHWRRLPREHVDELWLGLAEATFNALEPDLVVFDTYIRRPIKDVVRRLGIKQALIFRGYPRAAEDLERSPWLAEDVGLVILPHHREDPIIQGLPPFAAPTIFAGPIIRRTSSEIDLDAIRARYRLDPDVPTVVVSDGGGNALTPEDRYAEVVMEAGARLIERGQRLRMIVVAGPLRSRALSAPLVVAPGPWATVVEYEHHLIDLFAAADAVVCRGGYNTVAEIRHLGLPAIAVPAERRDDDQAGRLREAAEQSGLTVAPLDAAVLADLLAERLREGRTERALPPDEVVDVKRQIARRLLELAGGASA